MPAPAPGERPVEAGDGVVFGLDEVAEGDEEVDVDALGFVMVELDSIEGVVAPDSIVELDEALDEVAALFWDLVTALLPTWLRNSKVTVLPNEEGLKKK